MEATSIDGLVAHCQSGRFTGILRMRAREGIGEVWFLSGVADEVHFGTSTGDEAMERMRKASDATYELVARLPHPGGGFKKRFPSKGSIATATPVTLMRYCEQYALTGTLAVESGGVLVEVKYELGELVSVETTADDDGITKMLEAHEGTYELTLPRVELPAGTPVLPPATGLAESIPPPSIPPPESVGLRALLEIKPPAGRPASNEAEVKRKTVEIARQQKSATPRNVPRPVSTPKPAAEVRETKKEEPKPAPPPPVEETPPPAKAAPVEAPPPVEPPPPPKPVETEKEEAKPAAAQPAEEERDEESEEEEAAESEREPAEPSVPTAPRATQSWTWLVVPLLLLAAAAYLVMTHRF